MDNTKKKRGAGGSARGHRRGRGGGGGSSVAAHGTTSATPTAARVTNTKRKTVQEVNAFGRRKMTGFRMSDAFKEDMGLDHHPDEGKREEINDYLDGLGGWEDERYAQEYDSRSKADIDVKKMRSMDPKNLYAFIEYDLTTEEANARFECHHRGGMNGLVRDSMLKIMEVRRRNEANETGSSMRSNSAYGGFGEEEAEKKKKKNKAECVRFLSADSTLSHSDRTSASFVRNATFLEKVEMNLNPYVFLETWMRTFYRGAYCHGIRRSPDGSTDDDKAPSLPPPFVCQVGTILVGNRNPAEQPIFGDGDGDNTELEAVKKINRRFATSSLFTNLKRFFEKCVGGEIFHNHLAMKDKLISVLGGEYKEKQSYLPVLFSREELEKRRTPLLLHGSEEEVVELMANKEYCCHSWEKLSLFEEGGSSDPELQYKLQIYAFSEASLSSIPSISPPPPPPVSSPSIDSSGGNDKGKDKRKRKNVKVQFMDETDRKEKLSEHKKKGIEGDYAFTKEEEDGVETDADVLHLFDTDKNQNVKLRCAFFLLKQV